jgi:hypothetical protein
VPAESYPLSDGPRRRFVRRLGELFESFGYGMVGGTNGYLIPGPVFAGCAPAMPERSTVTYNEDHERWLAYAWPNSPQA